MILYLTNFNVDLEWFIPDPDPCYEFLEFRIRIQPILFKHIWKLLKRTLNSIKKKESTNYLPFSYFILQSYSTHNPEFTGLKLKITFLFICSFIFCRIRLRLHHRWKIKF